MHHPTAIIEPGAVLGENVTVGPYCYIGNDVVMGDNNVLESHVVVKGPSKIGNGNHFYQFGTIGEGCQDKKYNGEPTELFVGDNNIFRECVTIHRGTIQDESKTVIGSGNLLMAYAHVAHDCIMGDNNILANNGSLAGHVHMGDWVIIAGFAGAHQFCHIGSHSFVSAGSVAFKDVPPFVMASGAKAQPFGLNTEGMKRRGFDKDTIAAIKRAYRDVYRKGFTINEALESQKPVMEQNAEVKAFMDFITGSSRGIIR